MAGRRPSSRVVAAFVALLAAALVAVGGAAAWVLLRAEGPTEVAERYLAAGWRGDWAVQCDLAAEEWRRQLYEGHPFRDCEEFADTATEARADLPWTRYRADTEVVVTTEIFSEVGDRARVSYLIELHYRGDDRAGFEELLQGSVDRGTVELVRRDHAWRVAGVDEG